MNELSNQSLVYLVQLADEKIRGLRAEIRERDAEDPLLADIEEELVDCSMVSGELRTLYEKAAATSGNMPAYSQLVRA